MSEKPDPRVEIMAQAWMRDEDKYGDADAESLTEEKP